MLAVLAGVSLIVGGSWLLGGMAVAMIVGGVPLVVAGVLVEL